jgi:hypothetical protein
MAPKKRPIEKKQEQQQEEEDEMMDEVEAVQAAKASPTVHITKLDIDSLVIEDGFKQTEGNLVANITLPSQKGMTIEWSPGISWKLDATIKSEYYDETLFIPGYDKKLVRVHPGGNKAIVAIDDISILNRDHPKYAAVKLFCQVSNDANAMPVSIRDAVQKQYDLQAIAIAKLQTKAKALLVAEILKDPKKIPAFKDWAKQIKKACGFNSNMSDEDIVKKPEAKAWLEKTIDGIPMKDFSGSYTSNSGHEVSTIKFKVTYVKKHGGFSGTVHQEKPKKVSTLVNYFQKARKTKMTVFSHGISLWLTDKNPTLSIGFKQAIINELKSSSMGEPIRSAESLSTEDPENDVNEEQEQQHQEASSSKAKKQKTEEAVVGEKFIHEYLKKNPTPISVEDLAKALNVSVDEMIPCVKNLVDEQKVYENEEELLVAVH